MLHSLVLAFLLSHSLWAGARPSKPKIFMECFQRITLGPDTTWNTAYFRRVLGRPEWNGDDMMDYLSQSPNLAQLFAASAFTMQRYTVRAHTARVYARAEEQFPFFPADIAPPPGTDWKRLLKIAIALHDIGKPMAKEKRDKKAAPDFTVPIVEATMEQLHFTARQRKLVISLMSHDLIGDAARGRQPLEDVHAQLVSLAEENGMDPYAFFRVQLFFFNIDASSYENVERILFSRLPSGELVPDKQPEIENLRQLFLR